MKTRGILLFFLWIKNTSIQQRNATQDTLSFFPCREWGKSLGTWFSLSTLRTKNTFRAKKNYEVIKVWE
jgi:hypothetical protein